MSDQYSTMLSPQSALGDANRMRFLFRRMMAEVRTALPVQVIAVHAPGGVAPAGTVDVQPLVQQTDGAGNVIDLPVLYGLPYLRWQGGASAIILDPVVNDIGLVCFCDRDVSAVVAKQAKNPPGSNRRFSLSDGFFIGEALNAAPTQYLQFDPTNGIVINSPTAIKAQIGTGANAARVTMNSSGIVASFGGNSVTIDSSGIHFHGPVTGDSTATFTSEVKSGSIGLQAHHHTAQGATAPTTPAQA